jgi:hypothetical protein
MGQVADEEKTTMSAGVRWRGGLLKATPEEVEEERDRF